MIAFELICRHALNFNEAHEKVLPQASVTCSKSAAVCLQLLGRLIIRQNKTIPVEIATVSGRVLHHVFIQCNFDSRHAHGRAVSCRQVLCSRDNMNAPWMSAIELLAQICDVCSEVFQYRFRLLDVFELHCRNTGHTVDLRDHRFHRQFVLNVLIKFQRWRHSQYEKERTD